MSLTERTIVAAVTMGFAAAAPQPKVAPRYHWVVSQDTGAPEPTASAGATPDDRAAELARALRAYEEALRRRKETSP